MSIATSTAIGLIAAGAGAGASIYGAHKGAKASEKASQQQQQAADQALALQQRQYEQTRADLGPYREQGGQGLTALTALLGLGGPMGSGSGGTMKAGPTGGIAGATPIQPQWGGMAQGLAGVAAQMAPGGTLQRPGSLPGAPPASPSAYAPPPGASGGMVTLRAPNGQTQAVPAEHAAYYVARGAQQV